MNDIHSLEREKRRGDGHNSVAVLRQEHGGSWADAITEAARITEACPRKYLRLEAHVPAMCDALGLDDTQRDRVRMGVEAIRHWINGTTRGP